MIIETELPESEVPVKPSFPVEVKEPVVFAFALKGVNYWKFPDIQKTPSLRGLDAIVFYEEFKKRTTKELYQEEMEAETILLRDVRLALSGAQGRINLAAAFASLADWEKILRHREERLKFIVEPDLVWKLASIVYFDETENPNRYDMVYNLEKKIPFWKEQVSEEDFFLSKPIEELVPYLNEYKATLPTILSVTRMVREIHKENLSSIKSNLF